MAHELNVNLLTAPTTNIYEKLVYTGSVAYFDVSGLKTTVMPNTCDYISYRLSTLSSDTSIILRRGFKGPLLSSNGTIYYNYPTNYIMLGDDGVTITTFTQGSSTALYILINGYII